MPFDVDDSSFVTWNAGFNIGPDPGTTFTKFLVGTSKHLVQQNGYVLSLKEVDLTTNMTTVSLQVRGLKLLVPVVFDTFTVFR